MINLHAIANHVISKIHPNDDFIAIRCTGYANHIGSIDYFYGNCEKVSGQVQTLNGDELQQANEIMQGEISRKIFISTKGPPLTAGRRDTQEGASYLFQVNNKCFWKVYNISEDYTKCGWGLLFISQIPIELTPQNVIDALKASGFVTNADIFTNEANNGQSNY